MAFSWYFKVLYIVFYPIAWHQNLPSLDGRGRRGG